MLTVEIPEIELYDEETSTFFINSKKRNISSRAFSYLHIKMGV